MDRELFRSISIQGGSLQRRSFTKTTRTLKGSMMRKFYKQMMPVALLGLLVSMSSAPPARADTGSVRVVFTKGGFILGVGGGRGVLIFRGRSYPFKVSGASLGATIGASSAKLSGKALNMNSPRDIEGSYTALGASGAFVAGVGGVQLQNARGVSLQLAGGKVGLELSASLGGVTITLD